MQKEIQVENTIVVLEDAEFMTGLVRKNLSGFRNGSRVWTAELPSIPDQYVDVWLEGATIKAFAFSCHIVSICPIDGRILSATFTK